MPLRPPNYSTPRPAIRASRNSAGVETDNIYDENPNSSTFGKRIGLLGNTRAPLPDRTETRNADKTSLDAKIETYAAEALKQNGNDPDKAISYLNGLKLADPEVQKRYMALLPKIRQRVRERTRQGKRRFLLPSGVNPADLGLTPTSPASVLDEDDDE